MKKIEPVRGVEAFADEAVYREAVMSSTGNLLKGSICEIEGKKEWRGLIGKPLKIDKRLWISGGRGNKIVQEEGEKAAHMEWEHVLLHEVVPAEKWDGKIVRTPDARLDLPENKGYAVICEEEKKEYVLTGIRAFLTRTAEPARKETIDRSLDKKRLRREPPDLDISTAQLKLEDGE